MMSTFCAPEVSEGDFLGDYQVLDILGRGPMGTSYHVISNVLDKEFALKTLLLADHLPLEWLDRLEAQTALLSRITHPHIDTIINSGRSGDFWFCVKDFSHDGEGNPCDLRQYSKRYGGVLSHYQVTHILSQILSALDHVSEHHNLSHGNLKPENILIAHSAPFEVRLTDFQPYGLITPEILSKSYSHWTQTLQKFSNHITEKATTQVLYALYGSYDYKPPEWEDLKEGYKPSPQADMYSLGVIIYEMLTGSIPEGRFASPSQLRPDIPKTWDDILNQCLASRPDCRYGSYRDLLAEIEPDISPSTPPQSQPTQERLSLTPPGMVYIPASTFLVGSAQCGNDALPQHETSTKGFYIDRTPVTNGQFAHFVEQTGYITEAEQEAEKEKEKEKGAPLWVNGEWKLIPGISWRNPLGKKLPDDFAQHPVSQVSYADAMAYADWIGNTLPTEEEWEHAARGGQKEGIYPWGDTISRMQANYNGEGTSPVMSYQANGYGLFDMAGNVWEWTTSWFQAYPGNHRPNTHFGEKYKVVRGGAWMYDSAHCMISYRNATDPLHCYPTVGFRTVRNFSPNN